MVESNWGPRQESGTPSPPPSALLFQTLGLQLSSSPLSPGPSPPLPQVSTHCFLQWAAVRTQLSSMRTPPHSSRMPWNKAVCQGCEWASHSWPPSTLDSCALKRPAAGGTGFGSSPPGAAQRPGKTTVGSKGPTASSLPASSHAHTGKVRPPNMHGLPHRCARPLIEAHESHRVAHPSMLPHAPTCVCKPCLLGMSAPLSKQPCRLSMLAQYSTQPDTLLPTAVCACLCPPSGKPEEVPNCDHTSPPRPPPGHHPKHLPRIPAGSRQAPSPAQASNSKSRNIQVQTAAGEGCPMVGSGRGRRQG